MVAPRTLRIWIALLLMTVLVAVPASVAAQGRGPGGRGESSTPVAETPATAEAIDIPRLDLAAMALDSLDIPPELTLGYETYFDFDEIMMLMIGEAIPRATLEETGLQWFYQSNYNTPTGSTSVRSYATQYASDDGAIAGFELLENEATFVPDSAFTDEPLDLGDGPAELTIGAYESEIPTTGPTSIDLTFRVGSIVAGVGIDMQEGLTVDREMALQLATRLEERVRAVLAGEPIPAIDSTLPTQYVRLGPAWFNTNEGYWTLPDLYGPNVSADIASAFSSGYFWAGGYDPASVGGFPMPRAAIEVATFTDERAALLMLSSMASLRPNMAQFQVLTVDAIDGASVVLGYQFANQFFGESTPDSVRLIMLVGQDLLTVDVQGNGDVDAALAAARAIATAQVNCLLAEGPCLSPEFPETLWVTPAAEPEASPVG
jgi:hypothetical protein